MPKSPTAAKKCVDTPFILSVGRSGRSLTSRSELLERAGYRISTATSLSRAVDLAISGNPDVIVIGHRIPADERAEIAASAKRSNRSVSLVFLYQNNIDRAELADAILNADGDPHDLVLTIRYLLAKRRTSSR